MTGIYAKSVLQSRNTSAPDKVLSTLLVRMPRCILAEWNTHRVLSRNAASTRAIPTAKLIEQVMTDPFIPLVWGLNAKGMQSVGVHEDADLCEKNWLKARDAAVDSAERILDLGLHKQIAGRILEPWMWTIVCVSATEWTNFLELRDHKDAEPHIQVVAKEIRKCLEDKESIQDLRPGDWHLPFVTMEDRIDVEDTKGAIEALKALSVARCASTSYKTVEGFDMTVERAQAIFDKLVTSRPIHASPLEHVAQADQAEKIGYPGDFYYRWSGASQHRNFVGFCQYRAMVGA